MPRKNSTNRIAELVRQPEPPTPEEEVILRDPDLVGRLQSEWDKKIVGETDKRLAIFLVACGRLVSNCQRSSFNLLLNSQSSAGKDWVANKTLSILPQGTFFVKTRISEKALTYWHNSQAEPDWTWDGKVLLLTEISQGILNCDVLKCYVTDEQSALIVIDSQAIEFNIRGKPVIFLTTAEGNMGHEQLRRFPVLELDESPAQTRAIRVRQCEIAEGGVNTDYDPAYAQALSKLQPVKVVIPYARILIHTMESENIIMRTHNERFLDYIRASAALHQFQRERDERGYVKATPIDYEYARQVLIATTSNKLMIPLTKNQKRTIKNAKEAFVDTAFSVRELAPFVPFVKERYLYTLMNGLQEYGFFTSDTEQRDNSAKPVRVFRVVTGMDLSGIPNWDQLNNIAHSTASNATNAAIGQLQQMNQMNAPCGCDFNVNMKCSEEGCICHRCAYGSDGKPYCREHHSAHCPHPPIREETVE